MSSARARKCISCYGHHRQSVFFYVKSSIVGNVENWKTEYWPSDYHYESAQQAAYEGWLIFDHDDFLIAEVHGKQLVSVVHPFLQPPEYRTLVVETLDDWEPGDFRAVAKGLGVTYIGTAQS